ncbi:ATP-binding protein [Paucibacter sp. M5-1]|uniref:ATP-binding protein n=1 Tax=Paucibacter sp. M5-1 TaxID=3015998 RepID=UPI0022B8C84F|nr:hypothetical protein [Paucibacter sp. M5-1]MCZ7881616.1 hypothetical protein [Paucibacter sp. M5-1]
MEQFARPWSLRLLGAISARAGEQEPALHHFGSRSAAALLARLALQPQRSHAREELIELLWPGVDLATGRNRLRQTVFMLRQALATGADVLESDRLSLRLRGGALSCDVRQFEALLGAGRLAEACAAYGGEFMPGFYEDWIDEERLRLAALFEAARQHLALQRPAQRPATRALPVYLTRFFERAGERLQQAVHRRRLITLLGPGGSGKTRLAVETAHALQAAEAFDLLAFVPLLDCRSEEQLVHALAAALQLAVGSDPLAALLLGLADRRALLVLDNFEQLCGVGEALVARLLAELPGLHLLVSSRRVLGLDGECEWQLAPMALPARAMSSAEALASPALALFVDRARAVRPDFAPGPEEQADLVALLQLLDGMPLAIELAAARLRSLSVAGLLAEMQQAASGSALALLQRQGPRSGVDPRHASMQAVIAWSWQLLSPAEQGLLAGLTVFQGSFTAAAARQVCAATRPGLDELVAHSLLRVAHAGGEPRFIIGEPVREYAACQLDEQLMAAGRARHRHWMLAWARGLPAAVELGELRAELPNLQAAFASALADGAPADAIALALPLARLFEDVAPPADTLALLERAVQACTDTMLRSQGHSLLAPLLFNAGEQERARQHAQAGLDGAPPGSAWRGRALHAWARVRWRSSRREQGLSPVIAEALQLAHAGADLDLQASLLALQAFIANVGRDAARGEALHGQALALWERLGNPYQINSGHYNLAVSEHNAGRHAQALLRLSGLIEAARALQDWRRLGQSLNVQGETLAALRRWPEAAASYRACIVLAWDCLSPHDLAYGLWNLPRALAHLRDAERAVLLAAFIARYWSRHFGALGRSDHHDLRRLRRLAACQLEPARLAALWAEGERLSLAAAVQLAR